MGKLVEITKCEQCPHYGIRGHQFHTTIVKDRWENEVHLYFDEYIGFCRHWDRIIFDTDIENDIAKWCHLPDKKDCIIIEDTKTMLINKHSICPKYNKPIFNWVKISLRNGDTKSFKGVFLCKNDENYTCCRHLQEVTKDKSICVYPYDGVLPEGQIQIWKPVNLEE